MEFCFNAPINSVSFGQMSTAIIREFYRRKMSVPLFPLGQDVDLNSQSEDPDFFDWIQENCDSAQRVHSRDNPCLRLWHLNGSLSSLSKEQTLFTFYELDNPTEQELNIARNNKVVFSSQYSVEVFREKGVETFHVPLAFDSDNFEVINKKYHEDDRIVFAVCGKLEKRKRHEKIIQAWVKRFGNDKKYFLHCAVYNHFLTPEQNNTMISRVLNNKQYFNVSFFPNMAKNVTYNDFLNASNIVVGMSGGEGWGLPEFQAIALGKHGVIMNAHAYKDWANEENATLVNPSKKIDCYDGVFFQEGQPFNQGQIFDFEEDELINAFEVALNKHESNPVNENGLKLQKEFTFKNTVDSLLKLL